jgi:hypothetical protein
VFQICGQTKRRKGGCFVGLCVAFLVSQWFGWVAQPELISDQFDRFVFSTIMEGNDSMSFASLANEPPRHRSDKQSEDTYAWEAMRAQWVQRKPFSSSQSSSLSRAAPLTSQGTKNAAAKLVSGGKN